MATAWYVLSRGPMKRSVIVAFFVFDLLVAAAGFFLAASSITAATTASHAAAQANRTAAELTKVAETEYQACLQGNEERATARKDWRNLFALAAPHPTAAQKTREAQYLVVIDRDYAPVKCTPPPPPVKAEK